MLKLKKKSDCCGCGACFQICPANCINMKTDEEGFKYPVIDTDSCTRCGICVKVCPVINKGKKTQPVKILAAKNHSKETVNTSSSGGVFSVLAEHITASGNFVFGAGFNENWEVIHYGTSDPAEISSFRTSKYVQSDTAQSFLKIRSLLDAGKTVLFSGTPCQVRGLKLFLTKDYENLLTVDFICHGVPSPGIWKKYLQAILNKNSVSSIKGIGKINFRDKSLGWRKFSLKISSYENKTILSESLKENSFLIGFLKDLYLRPSCHSCPSKGLSSGSDITIADFWGVQSILPDFNDDKGISLVILNTDKMENILKDSCHIADVDKKVLKKNYALHNSVRMNFNRKKFFQELGTGAELEPLILKYSKHSYLDRFLRKLSIILSRIFN